VNGSGGTAAESYLRQPVGAFLDRLAAGDPTPGGGAAAAVAVALGAGLAAMAARLSTRQLPDAAALADAADALRRRAAGYADDDAAAYRSVLAARAQPAGPEPDPRPAAVAAALVGATAVPLAIAETGAEVAVLAGRLATDGNPNLRGDAVCGALLAAAGARAAAALVALNVAAAGLDGTWADRADAAARAAADAAGHIGGIRAGP
jgi:formiminotetrahydrofolate cyclodeaminase